MTRETTARLAACTHALSEFLERQSGALLDSARQPLLEAARDAGDRDEEDRLLSVLEEVESLTPQATDGFRKAMLEGLLGPCAPVLPDADAADVGGLSLVETAKVDDWLRLRAMLERQTDASRVLESEIWERLATLAGVPAHPDDNPISLQAICVQFQASMENVAPGRDARATIYDAFEATVVGKLSHLVARLQTLLDADASELPEMAPSGQEGTGPDAVEPPVEEPGQGGAQGEDPEGSARETGVDPTRMLGALAGVQRRELDAPLADLDRLEDHLLEVIAPKGVTLDERERCTVAAVSRLVREVVQDPEVDPAVQRRLSRLVPPLLMLALQDEDYLEAEMHSARHDPVTGLLDRAAFRSRLEAVCRRGRPVAVCLVDVDDFAQVTGRLGHQAGGRLLRALAELLRKHAGARGIVSRLRGDEFAVLLQSSKPGVGHRFADRYLLSLAGARFVFGGEEVTLRASIGVVEPTAGLHGPVDLMRAADAARNAAKAAGGGRVRVHGDDDP